MPAAFNDAAAVVIKHWREEAGAEGTDEEVLHGILNTVLPDEVAATLDQFPDDKIAGALSVLLNGPWLPYASEMIDIMAAVDLTSERVSHFTQLQRYWVHLARLSELYEHRPTRVELIELIKELNSEGVVLLTPMQELWTRKAKDETLR